MNDERKVDPTLRVATVVVVLVAAVVLIGALDGNPSSNHASPWGRGFSSRVPHQVNSPSYSYYTMLRWLACSAAVLLVWRGAVQGAKWAWALVPFAVLFNPIAPIHLSREAWQTLDIAAAVVMVLALILLEIAVLRKTKQ